MNLPPRYKLLPHEWFFGVFLLAQWLRLVVAAGVLDPDALLYAALLIANVAVIARCQRQATHLRWQVVNIRCPMIRAQGARMARKFLWRG
jgi:hypothetical protein